MSLRILKNKTLVSNPILKVEETFNKDRSLQERENRLKPTCRKYLEANTRHFLWEYELWKSGSPRYNYL